MKKYLFLLIAISVLIAGCQNTYCPPDEAEASIAELKLIAEEWDDALFLARSTPRMSLSGPIGELQQIRRNVSNLDVPECLEKSRKSLELGMYSAIEGMLAFMGQESDESVSKYFKLYNKQLDDYLEEIKEVNKCLPRCKAP